MSRITAYAICQMYSDVITPHQLRHFFASHALESGFTVAEVAAMCGHGSLNTTRRYLHPSREALKAKMDNL